MWQKKKIKKLKDPFGCCVKKKKKKKKERKRKETVKGLRDFLESYWKNPGKSQTRLIIVKG